MPLQSRYLFSASMDVQPDKEDVFNEVYEKEHVPMLIEVPGVISIPARSITDFAARGQPGSNVAIIVTGTLDLALGEQYIPAT